MLVAIVDELEVPVKLVGLGETPDALQPFTPAEFLEALFDEPAEKNANQVAREPENVARNR